MTVPQQTPYKSYIGNGISTAFPIGFLCLQAGDLGVYINGTRLTLADYTITDLTADTGGTVTFNTAPANGAAIFFNLEVVPKRETDYKQAGDFFANTVNLDFDRIWLAIQQAFGSFGRALLLGLGDVDGAGSYRAKGNRIQDLADPIDMQDAVNRQTLLTAIADFVTTPSGDVVLELLADTTSPTKGVALVGNALDKRDLANMSDLAKGAALVGYGGQTLTQILRDGSLRVVSTVAALKSLDKSRFTRAIVLGATALGDGKAPGVVYFDPSDTTSPDNGRTVFVALDGARWKTVFPLQSSTLAQHVRPSTEFNYVPGRIFECATSGLARHDIDLEWEFRSAYGAQMGSETGPSGAGDIWVDPVGGSDSNGGGLSAPVKTLARAIAIALGTIWLLPGRYTERFDVRNSYRQLPDGSSRAFLIKPWGAQGSVVFATAGQQPAEMTWVDNGSLWEATPAGGQLADLVLFISGGKEIPIQYKTSAAAVNAGGYGWYQDPTTKKISMRYQGRNINADKAMFEIIYQAPASPIVYGGKIYIEGIKFRGVTQMDIRYENNVRPVFYAKNCTWEYGGGANVSTMGAICFTQNCISRRALVNDGFNYYDSVAAGSTPGGVPTHALEIDNSCLDNGVPECASFVNFPFNQNRSKQGSSGHDTTRVCRINGIYAGNYGQNIADTGVGSHTWMVGSILGQPYGRIGGGDTFGGYFNLWTEGTAWLDTVKAGGALSTYGLWAESGVANVYRCAFSGSQAATGGAGSIVSYDAVA